MDVDLVNAVVRVGESVRVHLATGHEIAGVLVGLNLGHLVVEDVSGARHAIALQSVASVSTGPRGSRGAAPQTTQPSEVVPTPARPAALPSPALPEYALSMPGPTTSTPTQQGFVPRKRAGQEWPAIVISTGASELVRSRPLAMPAFEVAGPSSIHDVAAHNLVLQRIHQQFRYAEKQNELGTRFARCSRMAAETDALLPREPQSHTAFRLAGYLHFLADRHEVSTQRYVAASLIAGDTDPTLWHDTAIAAVNAKALVVAQHALLQYLDGMSADDDPDAWAALLSLSSGAQAVNLMHLLRVGTQTTPGMRDAVLEACHRLAVLDQNEELARRCEELFETGMSVDPTPLKGLVAPRVSVATKPIELRPEAQKVVRPTPPQSRFGTSRPGKSKQNDYEQAKYYEHRVKDFDKAKKAYRAAIQNGVNIESALKDLAWLTRRLHGPAVALQVLEEEFPGVLSPSSAVDQILIDFYIGAGRWQDALELLEPLRRRQQTEGQLQVILQRICRAKLSLGLDATEEASKLVDIQPGNPSIRTYAVALMQRAQEGDLDEAAELIANLADAGDPDASSFAAELERIRDGAGTDELDRLVRGLWDERTALLSALGQYMLDHFAESADAISEQRKSTPHDIRYLRIRGDDARRKRSRDRYDAYVSAAKVQLVVEPASDDATQQFATLMSRGLSALGDNYLTSNPEVAREIYGEALYFAGVLDQPSTEQDFWNSTVRYVRSLFEGPQALQSRTPNLGGNTPRSVVAVAEEITPELDDVPIADYRQMFEAVENLAARTAFASEAIIRAIESNGTLRSAARDYLAEYLPTKPDEVSLERILEAWRASALRQQAVRDEIDQRMRLLLDTDMSETSLSRACSIVLSVEQSGGLAYPAVDREALRTLNNNLSMLEEAAKEPSFEEQEFRYMRVREAMLNLDDRVRQSPTRFAVGTLLPIAHHIAETVQRTLDRLYETREPNPRVSLALEEYTPDASNRINVQVKLGNESGCAPVETPKIVFHDIDARTNATTEDKGFAVATVRGGDAAITRVPVQLSDELIAAGAFSLPITVEYRTRTGDRNLEVTLAVRLSSDLDFSPIEPNPFKDGATGRPVSDPRMFFGRAELVSQIESLLLNAIEPGAGVAVYGQKRSGKSSIRLHLSRALAQSGRFIVADIENIGRLAPLESGKQDEVGGGDGAAGANRPNETLQVFLWTILKTADQAVRAEVESGALDIEFLPALADRERFLRSPAPVLDFISYFAEFERHALAHPDWRSRRFIVMIDEFQYIADWIAEGLVAPTFVQALKAILEQRLFHLVVVGVDAMQTFIDSYPNEFGVFSKVRVNYLADKYAYELIDTPIQFGGRGGESRYRESAMGRILALTGGNPFYIQQFCSNLVEHMNSSKAPFVTEADVELVREILLSNFTPADFENLELSGNPKRVAIPAEVAREVLSAVAVQSGDGPATRPEIQARCSVDDLAGVLKDLEAREVVIQESGGYRILVQLYRDWLRRRAA